MRANKRTLLKQKKTRNNYIELVRELDFLADRDRAPVPVRATFCERLKGART